MVTRVATSMLRMHDRNYTFWMVQFEHASSCAGIFLHRKDVPHLMTARRRWSLLATVAAGLILITLDNSILYTALPTLAEDLGATHSERLWIVNAYPLVMAGLLLGSGTLGDRYGHRRLYLTGLIIFGVASLIAAFAPTALTLIGARGLLAVGAAAMMPATLALIRITFTDERERNIAIGVWGSMSVIGAALGPIISGALLNSFWWGSVFLINVPVVIVALVATVIVAPNTSGDPTKHWDLRSSVQVMIGIVGLVVLIKEFGKTSPSITIAIGATLAGGIGLTFFARRQRRLAHPLLDFAIFRNRAFASGVIGAAVAMFALAGLQLVSTQRFQLVDGFSPLKAGFLVTATAAGSLLSSLAGGALLHHIGLRILIAGGLMIAAIGAIITYVGVEQGLGWIIAGLFVVGLGIGATMSVASTAIVGNVPVERAGMASSVEEVSYEFGSLTAVAILGSLLSAIYTTVITLPTGAPAAAGEDIAEAVEIAARNPPGTDLLTAAYDAFNTGYGIIMLIIAGVLIVGTVATGRLLRDHGPGSAASEHGH